MDDDTLNKNWHRIFPSTVSVWIFVSHDRLFKRTGQQLIHIHNSILGEVQITGNNAF